MCWALYLASDKELYRVFWDEENPSFNTQELTPEEAPVKAQFSLPYVMYLGSHQGCSCGFMSTEKDGRIEKEARDKSIQELSSYLGNILTEGGKLQVFLCWEGDQGAQQVASKVLSPKDFNNRIFPLGEKEFANVVT
ncbi:hypothetical protein PVT67_07690 [Gallaecimonas kandeliae]|uniref:hypothetical protein n=1 Tax=Gallaecimonas kandeliae TaxID=3029055 RepID=UPI00264874F1|nr:hypothetical protein [Gallaecimonas kandeliae]WKE67107.1 hypothetical protein PVT67_07690 [Gallaecimonas kandeliae]